MLYNMETGQYQIIVMGGALLEENYSNFTSDGVVFDQSYSLEYRISGKKHRPCSIKFSGEELTTLASRCFGLVEQASDLYQIKKMAAHVVEIWAEYAIHGRIRPHLREFCRPEVLHIIKGAFKGKSNNFAWIRSFIAGYLYIQIALENTSRDFAQGATLVINDNFLTSAQIQDLLFDEKWKEQPITKRLNITSIEKFMSLVGQGALMLEWLSSDGNSPIEEIH